MGKAQRRKQENRLKRAAEEEAARARKSRLLRTVTIGASLVVLVAVALVILVRQQASDDDGSTSEASATTTTAVSTTTSVPSTTVPSTTAPSTTVPGAAVPEPEEAEEEEPMEVTSTAPSADEGETVDSIPDPVLPDGCPALDGSDGRRIDFAGPQPMCIDSETAYTAVFDTSEGEMRFDLTADATPLTVNNFVTLARWGYYDGTLLFRTDPSIDIIQGGSPHTNSPSDPGPGYNIPDEPAFSLSPDTGQPVGPYRYVPGQLVMARSAGFDSAGAQFFITTGPDASFLDSHGVYVVFGATDEAGLGVAQSIMDLHVDTGMLGGAPSRDVVVHSVTIESTLATP